MTPGKEAPEDAGPSDTRPGALGGETDVPHPNQGSDPQDTVEVCPECDSSDVYRRMLEAPESQYGPEDPRYWCRACGTASDELDERVRQGSPPRVGLSAKLDEADPDDLATDGGEPALLPGDRIDEAVKQLRLAREEIDRRHRPDRDAALAKAQYLAGGVSREMEEEEWL